MASCLCFQTQLVGDKWTSESLLLIHDPNVGRRCVDANKDVVYQMFVKCDVMFTVLLNEFKSIL